MPTPIRAIDNGPPSPVSVSPDGQGPATARSRLRRFTSVPASDGRTARRSRPARRKGLLGAAVIAVAAVLVLWVIVKLVVPVNGVSIGTTRILPRTNNGSLPSPLSVLEVLFRPEVNIPGMQSTGMTILDAALHSLRLAALGFAIGVLVGGALGLAMFASRSARHALLPYIAVAPTVPVLAIAPLVAAWSGQASFFGVAWQQWMSVVLITVYLTILPVATGMLRGLSSPPKEMVELMRSLAASRRDLFMRLHLPSAVPYLMPALKVAAAGAVVATIVSEISTGTSGGIGALIMFYVPQAAFDGSRLFAAVIAAAVLGVLATSCVSLLERALGKYQGIR